MKQIHRPRTLLIEKLRTTGNETILAKGYGYRDLERKAEVTPDTAYPIGSTTKAINATLLGTLVDEDRIAWDTAVQNYLPRFRLQDPFISTQVTLRDLLAMRTGLPRHDFVWLENTLSRADIVGRLAHLHLSAGLRERFQYSNLTATAAGHVAEVVMGQSWEDLVRQRLIEPLGMTSTGFGALGTANMTASYHESGRRQLVLSTRYETKVVAPAGGSIHSTVNDMARWIAFNLGSGRAARNQLIENATLQSIHSPWIVAGADPSAPSPNAAYGLGWFVDTYNGQARLSHTGLLNGVHSCVMLFPDDCIGAVSYVNFSGSRLAGLINEHVVDFLKGRWPAQSLEETLARYEVNVENVRQRNLSVRRVSNTSPSHPLRDYAGYYENPGHGLIEIRCSGKALSFHRNNLVLPLEHWHYDAWVAEDNELFEIHRPHAFDRAGRFLFDANVGGEIAAVSIRLEPAVAPIRFEKLQAFDK